MAKSKNHTNHNQNKKAHKNGIKRAKTNLRKSLKGVDGKFRRNQKFVKAGNIRVKTEKLAAAGS